MDKTGIVIEQTKKWIETVVIGCNFCPFATIPFYQQAIFYKVVEEASVHSALTSLALEWKRMEEDPEVETSLVIFTGSFLLFDDYLDLLTVADQLLKKEGLEGTYQLASFHPDYRFAGTLPNDAANFTNRSPYPMLHILREESVEAALKRYPNPGQIPLKNVEFARKKGTGHMKNLLDQCF
jgi:hypothetical protein